MKELSIEEKAKAYDNVVGKLKRFMAQGVDPLITRADVQDFFPEVKESEDERIRKGLIEFFKDWSKTRSHCWSIYIPDILAWLEKQGEQILDNSVQTCKDEKTIVIIPKFRIGDEIKTSNEESLIITKIDEKGYWSEDLFICDFDEECLWDLVEQNPAWSEEDELMLNDILTCGERHFYLDAGNIAWLKDLKDRVQPKLKQEWSEEELYKIEHALFGTYAVDIATRLLNKIKSLNPQSQWKPSDEQLKALDEVIRERDLTTAEYNGLLSLWKEFKELRE